MFILKIRIKTPTIIILKYTIEENENTAVIIENINNK
jgi:hypothetical protein